MKKVITPPIKLICVIVLFIISQSLSYAQISVQSLSPHGIASVYLESIPEEGLIKDVNKIDKTKVAFRIENSNGSSYASKDLYDGFALIRGRGNTTWSAPKKPYNVWLIDEEGADNPSKLLGMPKHEEWALIANYYDKTMLRIPLAYNLGNWIGMDWTPRLYHVELYIDGIYNGLYCLCEKIERDKNRVNIAKIKGEEYNDPELISGGYILEITPESRIDPEDSVFYVPKADRYFTIKYPKAKNITTEQKDWIANYVYEFDSISYSANYNDPENGFKKYIDEDAAVDWYLINALAKNADAVAMFASVFLWKDRDEKLKFGPLWDFDIGFGNHNTASRNYLENIMQQPAWYGKMFQDKDFAAKFRQRYEELKPLFDSIPKILQLTADELVASGAIARNFEKWPILGEYVWPNPEPFPLTYQGEIDHLSDWIVARNSWMQVNMLTDNATQDALLADEKLPIRVVDTDEFAAGDSARIRTVNGYQQYIWNDTIITDVNELKIADGGLYWVNVSNGRVTSTLTDTLTFIAAGKILYGEELMFEYDGNPQFVTTTTAPLGLNIHETFFNLNEPDSLLSEIIYPGRYLAQSSIVETYYKGSDSIWVLIKGVYMPDESLVMMPDDEYLLTAYVESGDDLIAHTWSSDNPEIAHVDQNGNLIALAEGQTLIRVMTDDNLYQDSCSVTVNKTLVGTSTLMANQQHAVVVGKETITFNLTADSSHSITLFDLTGKPQATYTTTQTQYVIDKSKFAHGVYLIVIENKDTSVKVKVVL
ncbi:MAG: CotH kinase family protein [Firmicutes bacterium]|nr:CotH kinase family protein [Bacillota bacterium]